MGIHELVWPVQQFMELSYPRTFVPWHWLLFYPLCKPFYPGWLCVVFSFPGSRFPGARDSRPFSFPDSWELKRRHFRRKAGTSHTQLVVKWDARQWLQRVQTSLAGQLTAAGSRSTNQLCCVHYRALAAVVALQDSDCQCHPCLSSGSVLQLTYWDWVRRHWQRISGSRRGGCLEQA